MYHTRIHKGLMASSITADQALKSQRNSLVVKLLELISKGDVQYVYGLLCFSGIFFVFIFDLLQVIQCQNYISL